MAGALAFHSACRAIKRGELAPVYVLTGVEDVLKDDLVVLIRDHCLDAATRDFNFDSRSAADLDGERFHSLVETPPMLAQRRVVVVRNPEQWRKNAKVWTIVERYVSRPSASTVLVMVYGSGEKTPHPALRRHGVEVEAARLDGPRLERWAAARVARAGFRVEPDALTHLVRVVGGDLTALALEIEKLAAAHRGEAPVTVAEVAALVGVRRGETAADWVTAVLERDIPRAVAGLDTVLAASGMSAVRLASLLGTSLVGVRAARALQDAGVAGPRMGRTLMDGLRSSRFGGLGSWEEHVSRWTRTARRWSAPALDEAIAAVYEADRALKSTTVRDVRGVLTEMLLRIGGREVAA